MRRPSEEARKKAEAVVDRIRAGRGNNYGELTDALECLADELEFIGSRIEIIGKKPDTKSTPSGGMAKKPLFNKPSDDDLFRANQTAGDLDQYTNQGIIWAFDVYKQLVAFVKQEHQALSQKFEALSKDSHYFRNERDRFHSEKMNLERQLKELEAELDRVRNKLTVANQQLNTIDYNWEGDRARLDHVREERDKLLVQRKEAWDKLAEQATRLDNMKDQKGSTVLRWRGRLMGKEDIIRELEQQVGYNEKLRDLLTAAEDHVKELKEGREPRPKHKGVYINEGGKKWEFCLPRLVE